MGGGSAIIFERLREQREPNQKFRKKSKNFKKLLTNERTYDKIIKCLVKGVNN